MRAFFPRTRDGFLWRCEVGNAKWLCPFMTMGRSLPEMASFGESEVGTTATPNRVCLVRTTTQWPRVAVFGKRRSRPDNPESGSFGPDNKSAAPREGHPSVVEKVPRVDPIANGEDQTS